MIYFIGELGPDGKPNGIVKIGWTEGESANGRLSDLQCGNARRLKVLNEISGGRDAERILDELFADWRLGGEWFAFGVQSARVLGWKKVVCVQTLLAALGARYADRARRLEHDRLHFSRFPPPPLPEVKRANPHDVGDLFASNEDDPFRPPAWLASVVSPPDPDDDPASGGMALPHPGMWARRVKAAGVILERAAA
jgi:Meiotically up-regulated gene 113